MQKELILDSRSVGDLMAIASSEMLVHEDVNKTDGFLQRFVHKEVSEKRKTHILEQIILSDTLTTTLNFPEKGISGRLLEEGILKSIKSPSLDDIKIKNVPLEIIWGMVSYNGSDLSISEIPRLIEDLKEASIRGEEHFKNMGKSYPTAANFISSAIIQTSQRKRVNMDLPVGYTEQDMKIFNEYKACEDKASPIISAFSEYQKLQHLSETRNAMVILPHTQGSSDSVEVDLNLENTFQSELALFRVVSKKLGKLTCRETLEESIALSQDPASISLKEHLPIWLNKMAEEDLSSAELAEKEISLAIESNAKAAKRTTGSRIVGYFAAPVATMEFFLSLPPLLGLNVELVSRILARKGVEAEQKCRWISFGNVVIPR